MGFACTCISVNRSVLSALAQDSEALSIQTQLVHCRLPVQALHIICPFACVGTWKIPRISVAPSKIYDGCHCSLC